MKIIFSPSKGMETLESEETHEKRKNRNDKRVIEKPLFREKSKILREKISQLSKEEFQKKFKLKGKLLEEAYEIAKKKGGEFEKEALLFYKGVSFRNLELEKYTESNLKYAQENVVILSAMYGALRALDKIKEYRLDMTIKILDESLYNFWEKEIQQFFIDENELIINLASSEFSKTLDRKKYKNILDIEFRQNVQGEIKNISTEAKKARGSFLNYMIENEISLEKINLELEKLKKFNCDGYIFSEKNSNEKKFMFIKKDS